MCGLGNNNFYTNTKFLGIAMLLNGYVIKFKYIIKFSIILESAISTNKINKTTLNAVSFCLNCKTIAVKLEHFNNNYYHYCMRNR